MFWCFEEDCAALKAEQGCASAGFVGHLLRRHRELRQPQAEDRRCFPPWSMMRTVTFRVDWRTRTPTRVGATSRKAIDRFRPARAVRWRHRPAPVPPRARPRHREGRGDVREILGGSTRARPSFLRGGFPSFPGVLQLIDSGFSVVRILGTRIVRRTREGRCFRLVASPLTAPSFLLVDLASAIFYPTRYDFVFLNTLFSLSSLQHLHPFRTWHSQ